VPGDAHPFITLAEDLKEYDCRDLLAATGALQLIPQNAERTLRLEALANVAASIQYEANKPVITPDELQEILTKYPLGEGALAAAEDPYENLFTEAFAFYGGSYTVLPGILGDSTFILEHLATALLRHPTPFPHYRFQREARELLWATLALSNTVCSRANLARNLQPVSASDDVVFVPSEIVLAASKTAVMFKPSEVVALLREFALPITTLNQLLTHQGSFDVGDYSPERHPLLRKPLVQSGNVFVVAIPGAMLGACRHELLVKANKYQVTSVLADRYTEAVWHTVIESFEHLGNSILPLRVPGDGSLGIYRDGFFNLDTDKLLYALLVTDPLTEYNFDEVYGFWDCRDLGQKIESRLQQVEEFVYTRHRTANEVFLLVIMQGAGRSMAMGFQRLPSSSFLSMSAADLELIAWSEGTEPLVLWKYAHAASKIRRSAIIQAFSQLDEFQFYKANNYSYYAADDARYDTLYISSDVGAKLRFDVQNKRDWHATDSYEPNLTVEVTLAHDDPSIPIYITLASVESDTIEILVEGLPKSVWIVSLPEEGVDSLRATRFEFVEAIAYWIWQCTPSLTQVVAKIRLPNDQVVLRINLSEHDRWERPLDSDSEPIQTQVDETGGTIDITFSPSIHKLLSRAENSGEREILLTLLRAFRELLPHDQQPELSDEKVNEILDRHAPLGIKKKIVALDVAAKPELDPRRLPPFRKVQPADVSELLDELGDYLFKEERLPIGDIPNDRRTSIINQKVVPFCVRELELVVGSLKPEGLLEWLIAHHESIVREVASHQLTIPTRLACFTTEVGIVEKLRKEAPERTMAGTAARFIIEYVATCPPRGLRPISLSVYDRLQALASQIINYGFESDIIHFGLADIKMSMLPSGRLGFERDQYVNAFEAYQPALARGDIARASRSFKGYWDIRENIEDEPELAKRVNAASRVEFGFSITEIMEFLRTAVEIGREIDPTMARLLKNDFLEHAVDRLSWSHERVEQALALLSIAPRDDYFAPDHPHKIEDVYPWRFNRSLSYVRRPFLIRGREQQIEILWGIRNLFNAATYLVRLCSGGRLKAESLQMRQVLGEIIHQRGEDFNDLVAEIFEKQEHRIVRRRVKKVGSLRITGDKGDLGDIDVLVADLVSRTLMVAECKDLAVARTPFEMAREMDNLFRGQGERPSIVERHQKRSDWVKNHVPQILEWLKLDSKQIWQVEPVLIVDQELMSVYLQTSPIPVVSLEELRRALRNE
jgi:hypothetical protein